MSSIVVDLDAEADACRRDYVAGFLGTNTLHDWPQIEEDQRRGWRNVAQHARLRIVPPAPPLSIHLNDINVADSLRVAYCHAFDGLDPVPWDLLGHDERRAWLAVVDHARMHFAPVIDPKSVDEVAEAMYRATDPDCSIPFQSRSIATVGYWRKIATIGLNARPSQVSPVVDAKPWTAARLAMEIVEFRHGSGEWSRVTKSFQDNLVRTASAALHVLGVPEFVEPVECVPIPAAYHASWHWLKRDGYSGVVAQWIANEEGAVGWSCAIFPGGDAAPERAWQLGWRYDREAK